MRLFLLTALAISISLVNLKAQDSTYYTQRLCNCLANDAIQKNDSLLYWIKKGANANGFCKVYSNRLRTVNHTDQIFTKAARTNKENVKTQYAGAPEIGLPLHAAYPDLNKIKFLLANGAHADLQCPGCMGSKSSFLQFVVEHHDSTMLNEILKYPVSFGKLSLRSIHDVHYLKKLIRLGADYKTVDVEQIVQTADCRTVKFLFDSIYPVNEMVLNIDIFSGALPISRINRSCLLSNGFKYSQLTGDGFWLQNKTDSLITLFREGMDPNLHMAAKASYLKQEGYPITFLAFKKVVNYNALDVAIEKKFDLNQSMEVRVDYGSSISHHTPLGYAIAIKDTLLTDYFLSKGADINACSKEGLRAIHHAIKVDDLNLVKRLIAKGTNLLDEKTSKMPLKYAKQVYAKPEMVALLEIETAMAKKKK